MAPSLGGFLATSDGSDSLDTMPEDLSRGGYDLRHGWRRGRVRVGGGGGDGVFLVAMDPFPHFPCSSPTHGALIYCVNSSENVFEALDSNQTSFISARSPPPPAAAAADFFAL